MMIDSVIGLFAQYENEYCFAVFVFVPSLSIGNWFECIANFLEKSLW